MAAASKRIKTLISSASEAHQTSIITGSVQGPKENGGRDRFSELPDDVLVHILSFLPTYDAVRTVLLRSFGNLWTLVPSLVFEDGEPFLAKKLSCIQDEDENTRKWSGDNLLPLFTSYIRHVLMHHERTSIDRFDLRLCKLHLLNLDDDKALDVTEVHTWINFAVNRQVKALDLHFYHGVDATVLASVFTSSFLVTLKLFHCVIQSLSQVHMGSLRELSLNEVDIVDETFKELIAGCPSLQQLHIKGLWKLNELWITAPSIEKLDAILIHRFSLLHCPNVKILNFSTFFLPKIVDVSSVCRVNFQIQSPYQQVESLLNKFCNVEVFKFANYGFSDFKLEELDFLQTRWKRLCFQSPVHLKKLLGICKLLRSSPYLEEITIYNHGWRKQGTWRGCTSCFCEGNALMDFSSQSELTSPCVMPQIKTVRIVGYNVVCQHGVLQLAKFLLRSATKLEKLVIIPNVKDYLRDTKVRDFERQLSSLPRASPNARVVRKKITFAWGEWLESNSPVKRWGRILRPKSLKKILSEQQCVCTS